MVTDTLLELIEHYNNEIAKCNDPKHTQYLRDALDAATTALHNHISYSARPSVQVVTSWTAVRGNAITTTDSRSQKVIMHPYDACILVGGIQGLEMLRKFIYQYIDNH